jgi:alpha-ketoglutarate-dependent taurine dioxygenase
VHRNPFFQVLFTLQNQPEQKREIPDLELSPYPLNVATTAFDVTLSGQRLDDGSLRLSCRYSTDLFDVATIEDLLDDFRAVAETLTEEDDTVVRAIDLPSGTNSASHSSQPTSENNMSNLDQLKDLEPESLDLSEEEKVTGGRYDPDETLPYVMQPNVDGVDVIAWADAHRDRVEEKLQAHGAVLFRDFDLEDVDDFERFSESVSADLLDYTERSSPRTNVGGKVYTSTDYPPDQRIRLHNEQSYSLTWPLKIMFFCEQPPSKKGDTPVADSRRVLERMDSEIARKFDEKGIMYLRNYGGGLGLSWEETFQTTDKEEVEAYCDGAEIDLEWKGDGRLQTRQVRPAIREHPRTGERVWFNHAVFFHVTSLEDSIRKSVEGLDKDSLPQNTYYGDGTPIESDVLDHIRHLYAEERTSFPWQKGDVLVVDNMLAAHGRQPFEGPREIAVTMAEPYSGE